jgi:hypothetical protein
VEGAGLVTGAGRGLRPTVLALVLAVPLLAGCDAAQQAQQGVDKAADCAGLVGELSGIDWNDVRQAARNADAADARKALADVEAAARRLASTCGVDVDQVGG